MKKAMPKMAVAALALILAACGGDSQAETTTSSTADPTTTSSTADPTTTSEATATTEDDDPGDASIIIENFTFSGVTTVSAGTTVTATNQDGVTHTWTSVDDVWSSGGLASGESFEFTFDEPGEYAYFCTIHPTMEGTITVEG